MKHTVRRILIFSIIILFALPASSGFSVQSIKMDRAKLEPPTGMKIYEFQAEQLDLGAIQNLAAQKGLDVKAMRMRTPRGEVDMFAERDSKVNRLFVNQSTGHINLVPHIEKLAKTSPRLLEQGAAFNQAVNHAKALKLVPTDVSHFTPNKLLTLSSAELDPKGQKGPTKNILQTVQFGRTINNKAVMGAGSQLHVALGDNGALEGFGKRANKLAESKLAPSFKNDNEVYGEIEKHIAGHFPGNVSAMVRTPRLVYFGESGKFVQPAYHFDVEIMGQGQVGKIFYQGVVSALKNPPEAIRRLRGARELPTQAPTQQPPKADLGDVQVAQAAIPDDDPTVCRYAVREDSWDWVDDANDFKNGLNSGHPAGWPAITFLDWYWDQPYMWTTSNDYYADKCHVSLMEGHGNHWLFTTRSNCCDVVNLNAATQPGYGDKAGDSMRLLVLKGCSIVPSAQDRPADWPAPWWRIFKGLRVAVGFRTTMYINDDISDNFGNDLARGVRVIDAWFNATNSSWSYGWNRFWGAEVTGYGSVILIPGYGNTTLYDIGRAPNATSVGLTNVWQH